MHLCVSFVDTRVASVSSKSGCVLFAFGCIFVLSALCSPSSKHDSLDNNRSLNK